MATLALIVLIISTIVNTFFGLAVLTRTYQRAYGWYFGATLFGVSLWAIGDMGMLLSNSPAIVHAFSLLFYIAPMITPVCIWLFALSFPENRPVPRWATAVGAGAFAVFALIFLFKMDLFIQEIVIKDPINEPIINLPTFLFYATYFSVFFVAAYIAFMLKIKRLRGLNRTQVSYTFWGVLLGSSLALVSNLSLPIMGNSNFIWLGPFFTLIFAGTVTAAIVRHRLFDIRLVIARSIGYILSVASLVVLYGLVTFTVLNQIIFDKDTVNFEQQMVYTIMAASLAFTFHPVRRFFEKISNNLFYRDAYDPQVFLDQLNRTLVANTDLKPMLREAAAIIQANLKVEFCMFWVGAPGKPQQLITTSNKQFTEHDEHTAKMLLGHINDRIIIADTTYASQFEDKMALLMTRNNVALLARLVPENQSNFKESMGYMALGNKKSGNPLTNADLNVIRIIVNELVIAVENALRFQEIENFNATLQQKVDEATKKLRRTNDKLRSLDETKDDFISMASHQLRTPLTSVKGYVSMVLDGDAGRITPLQRKLLNQSFISAQRMVYLISDLLNVSRLRTGKFVIEAMPSNLATVIKEEVDQLVETAKGRNLTLSYQKPEHFPTLLLDETKMRQVIMNFIDNAIYYTPSGGQITVGLADKGNTIEFTVSDNGIGVPKSEQHHLFSKFYRAPNAKRARPDGTGLGLFMAKKVIIAQGGAVVFKSQEGKGSTFGFTFNKEKIEAKE